MKLAAALLLVLAMLIAPPAATAADAPDRGIEAAIRLYFQANENNDAAALARAFHASTVMFWTDAQGRATSQGQYGWRTRLRAPETPKQRASERRIVWVEALGDSAAAAVVSRLDGRELHDFLTLLKIGGEWKIVGKVFSNRPVQPSARAAPDAVTDERRVRAVIERKMTSMDDYDGALLSSGYLPQATTASLLDGEIEIFPIAEWAARFDARAAAGQREAGVTRRIERVEIAGDAAYVRFSHRFPNMYVVDRALLVRHDSHWRIAHLDYLITDPPPAD
jgi:protease I